MNTIAIRHFLFSLVATFLASMAQAQAPSAMVLSVDGDVSVEVLGKPGKLDAFTRLLEGDRVKLGKSAKLSLIYTRSSRQESWTGPGAVVAGNAESTAVNGKPQVEVKQLPAKVAQMIAHTPAADSTGKAGMVRLRAIAQPDELASLEKTYQDLRASSPANDRNPEVYFLAGLFKLGEYDRLNQELNTMQQQNPGDESIKLLAKIYARSIDNARRNSR